MVTEMVSWEKLLVRFSFFRSTVSVTSKSAFLGTGPKCLEIYLLGMLPDPSGKPRGGGEGA